MFDDSYDTLMQLRKLREETQQIDLNKEYSDDESDSSSIINETDREDIDQSEAQSNLHMGNQPAQIKSQRDIEILSDNEEMPENFTSKPKIDEIVNQQEMKKTEDTKKSLVNQEIIIELESQPEKKVEEEKTRDVVNHDEQTVNPDEIVVNPPVQNIPSGFPNPPGRSIHSRSNPPKPNFKRGPMTKSAGPTPKINRPKPNLPTMARPTSEHPDENLLENDLPKKEITSGTES